MKNLHIESRRPALPDGHRLAWSVFRGGLRGHTLVMLWLIADYHSAVNMAKAELMTTDSDIFVWSVSHNPATGRTQFL